MDKLINKIAIQADGLLRGNLAQIIGDLDQLPNAITHGAGTGLKLQPNFAAWMMGYPLNWANLNCPSQNIEKSN